MQLQFDLTGNIQRWILFLPIILRTLDGIYVGLNWWGLFYGTERNGTERNDGLNHGTERFLKLKLATYRC